MLKISPPFSRRNDKKAFVEMTGEKIVEMAKRRP